MKITRYTDYSLRILLYLALHPDRDVPVPEIAEAYSISSHHVAKAAKALTHTGFVSARRGRSGGLRLGRSADSIRVGDVVRSSEDLNLLECFDAATNECVLTPACRLKNALAEARKAFLAVLDGHRLSDLARHRTALLHLLPPAS